MGRFCEGVVDRPDRLNDERFETLADRMEHVEELEQEIEAIFATRTSEYWIDRLDAAGVPGGPVYTYDETLADRHVRARGMVDRMKHPLIGEFETLGIPIKYSGTPLPIRQPAPWLGQHTEQSLAGLRLPELEIAALFDQGIVYDSRRERREDAGTT